MQVVCLGRNVGCPLKWITGRLSVSVRLSVWQDLPVMWWQAGEWNGQSDRYYALRGLEPGNCNRRPAWCVPVWRSCGSSVDIVTRPRSERHRNVVRFQAEARGLSLLRIAKPNSRAHPPSQSIGARGGGVNPSICVAEHEPPSSSNV